MAMVPVGWCQCGGGSLVDMALVQWGQGRWGVVTTTWGWCQCGGVNVAVAAMSRQHWCSRVEVGGVSVMFNRIDSGRVEGVAGVEVEAAMSRQQGVTAMLRLWVVEGWRCR
ncbi:hypothetical protein EDB85DRAFT_1889252 [Lactarius pseudohatsudake]|nr:hypothetical protein EDB85DRAFT_1889252 [Lactarius pseudohatsudake]